MGTIQFKGEAIALMYRWRRNMKKISWMILLIVLMTACFPKEAQHEHHQRHTDDSSTVKIGNSTSETSGSENENTTVFSNPTESFGPKYKDITVTVISTRTETSDKVTITDLWRAIEERNQRTVAELIRNPEIKKHIDTQNEKGETALSLSGEDIWFVKQLLEAGANPIFPNGDTILMKFAEQNLPVDPFLEIPAVRDVINAQNEKGETALFLTGKGNRIYIGNIQDLLEAGADPTIPDKTGKTVLSVAYKAILLAAKNMKYDDIDYSEGDVKVSRKYYDVGPITILEDLLKAGADPILSDGDTILMKYSLAGVSVSSLLEIPAVKENINIHNDKGETVFFLAAKEKHWEVMAELARNNAGASSLCAPHNLPDNIPETELVVNRDKRYNILMICSLAGQADGVKKLLENPTVHKYINSRNSKAEYTADRQQVLVTEETAFSLATEGNHWEVIAELARNNADDIKNSLCAPHNLSNNIPESELSVNQNKPYNILMICSLAGQADGVKKLLEIPAVKENINVQNEEGETAFSLAAKETLSPKPLPTADRDRSISVKRILLWKIMRVILSAGADPHLLPEKHSQEIQQIIATVTDDANFGDTFLMYLVRKGVQESIEKLLEIPAVKENIDTQNDKGETAFFLAKKKGHTQIMALLLKAGTDPDIVPPVSGK